jgi:hypothetical protein
MNDFGRSEATTASLRAAEWNELVQRIIASRPFARAPQLKDFLVFIVERVLADDVNSINETEIGRHVLRRRQSDFDPNTDNIVRVQARHLRKKLEEYFNEEGRHEPVLLTIPKGSYVPKLAPRDSAAGEATPAPAAPRPSGWRGWLVIGTAAVLAALAIWAVARTGFPLPGRPTKTGPQAETDPLWAALARTGRKTSIVLSDSSVSVVQNLLRKRLTLSQYLSPGYPADLLSQLGDRQSSAMLGEITRHAYTSLNSAIVASRLYHSGRKSGVEAPLRFPRDITLREFKSENFLLIGSIRSVPWMELIEGQLNFTFCGNPQSLDFYICNKAPRAGEQAAYRPALAADGARTEYATIALLPNLNGTGLIVCLQGMTGMANEAAEELISDPRTSPLHQILRAQPQEGLPRAEILVRATGMSGAPANVQVVATRVGASAAEGGAGSR